MLQRIQTIYLIFAAVVTGVMPFILNIILNLFLLGLFMYRLLTVSGETSVSEKGIGMFLPIVAIVFLVLANKAIKKDEDLVKSADRLR